MFGLFPLGEIFAVGSVRPVTIRGVHPKEVRAMGILPVFVSVFFVFVSAADDRDVSDFAWNKVKVIKGNRDVVNWRETKQIKSVAFSKRGICFDRPVWEEWPHVPGHAVFPDWDG